MKKIGLIAGVGRLPVEFARAARGMGVHVICVGVLPEVDPELAQVTQSFKYINIAKLDRILKALKREQVTEITLLGKINNQERRRIWDQAEAAAQVDEAALQALSEQQQRRRPTR